MVLKMVFNHGSTQIKPFLGIVLLKNGFLTHFKPFLKAFLRIAILKNGFICVILFLH